MTAGLFTVPVPKNEPVLAYAPGSSERTSLEARVRQMQGERAELHHVIGGERVSGSSTAAQVSPHRHQHVVADFHTLGDAEVDKAIDAALAAQRDWAALPWQERAAVFLKAADLLAGPYRDTINAATILGQSKSVQQAEIDAACELIDFLRFNVGYAERIYTEQPESGPGMWNRMDHRPLEGFVLAITPFNFTAIAGNLPTAPALMGNVVVWKPSEKAALAAHYIMEVLHKAGLPDGVINLVHGDGATAVDVATRNPAFAGLHFTGSTEVFRNVFRTVGDRINNYRAYPRIVGESGGKDFVVAHRTASVDQLVVALGRGAFEYQGQKCSAASRAYVPASLWPQVRDGMADLASELTIGDVGDLSTFAGGVIDAKAFAKQREAIDAASQATDAEVVIGGHTDDSEGWFVHPTVIETSNPAYDTMSRELFGPVLTVYVYDDAKWTETLDLVDQTSQYALTGGVFAQDRYLIHQASERLRNAAGNFYVNDKPTGSVVGQQPFGGARGSGTNDKAGSILNLLRWVSTRAIKETWDAPTDWRYPHQG